MADISSDNITTTPISRTTRDDHRKEIIATLVLGFGASLTYPAGGVPLVAAQLGFPKTIDAFEVLNDGGVGYEYDFMPGTQRLRMFYPATASVSNTVATELTGGSTAPGSDITIQIRAFGR